MRIGFNFDTERQESGETHHKMSDEGGVELDNSLSTVIFSKRRASWR